MKLQPFDKLLPLYFDKLQQLGKKYFVSQSYPRANDYIIKNVQVPILVSVYDDMGLAKTHLNAIKLDKYAGIIDLTRLAHKQKLLQMVLGETQFVVYWAAVNNVTALEKRINIRYKQNIRRYIEKNTNWRIMENAAFTPRMLLIFGELYINLKHGSQQIRVKFEDVENG